MIDKHTGEVMTNVRKVCLSHFGAREGSYTKCPKNQYDEF